jgi:hypothetical protein
MKTHIQTLIQIQELLKHLYKYKYTHIQTVIQIQNLSKHLNKYKSY